MIVAIDQTYIDRLAGHPITHETPTVGIAVARLFHAVQPVLDQQPMARLLITLEVVVENPEPGSFVHVMKPLRHDQLNH